MKNINVTFFSSSTSRVGKIITLSQVLSDFRTGRYAEAIENVRLSKYSFRSPQVPLFGGCHHLKDAPRRCIAASGISPFSRASVPKLYSCAAP